VRRTSIVDLAVPFVIVGITVYVLLRFSYNSLPPLGYFVSVPLGVLAVVEYMTARRVRAAVRHEPQARAMPAITIARCVALGKASSLVSAGVAGAAAGLLGRVAPKAGDVRAAADDTRAAAILIAACLLLLAAGLALERAGIDPNSDADRDDPPRR
jgi:hypothetical protein